MRIAIASDHAGFGLKEAMVRFLREEGYEVLDLGPFEASSVDYPDFGKQVAERVSKGEVEAGVLLCGTGVGMAIVANKFPGVRAALVNHVFTARQAKEHLNANVLCLGGRVVGEGLAQAMIKAWLEARFQGGRHSRRLSKIEAIERENFR
ncbi:MAG: ribose 5-phosphate isomerase B [Deltaproteobacteria bacterium]|nr:MAG: ribose 5-phosphate isomerase B [Deltaproteobacteria bacterium]